MGTGQIGLVTAGTYRLTKYDKIDVDISISRWLLMIQLLYMVMSIDFAMCVMAYGTVLLNIFLFRVHLNISRLRVREMSNKLIKQLNKSASRCIPHTTGQAEGTQCNTLRSPLSAEFWRHCVLSGRSQHRALPRHQNEEMEI